MSKSNNLQKQQQNPQQSKATINSSSFNISEAQTSEEQAGRQTKIHMTSNKKTHNQYRPQQRKFRHQNKILPEFPGNLNSQYYASSFNHKNPARPSYNHQQKTIQRSIKIDQKDDQNPANCSLLNQIPNKVGEIILEIEQLDFQNLSFSLTKQKIAKVCQNQVRFETLCPEPLSNIGEQLLKNGRFHAKWKEALTKCPHYQSLFDKYYDEFKSKVDKEADIFQKAFKSHAFTIKHQVFDQVFAKYRKQFEENTKSSTKMDAMILYQQVKQQIKLEERKQNEIQNRIEETLRNWKMKVGVEEKALFPRGEMNLIFEDEQSIKRKWEEEQDGERKESIKKIVERRSRERSPLSLRFRMMHQCQTNERRLQVEMACLFLDIKTFYYLNELEIAKIEETIFSATQEIIVLKAYTVDFCPQKAMLTIQPKLKNLIGVYRFCGLSELIRLETTYGGFDGIIVYPQSFDIQKYLTSNKEPSLIRSQYLKQIKQQKPPQENASYY